MRQASLLVLLLGVLLVVAGPVAAQDDNATANETTGNETVDDGAAGNETTDGGGAPSGPVTINLVGHQEGGSFYFTLEGETQRNPRLVVPPGAEVTVILRSASGTHNFHPEGMEASAYASEGEAPITYTFTAPAQPTTLQYWCDPHRSAGMAGTLQVGEAGGGDAPTGGGDAPEVQGETVDLGDLGYDDCAGFLIPASSARGAVGGPTVEDYVRLCREGEAPMERGAHVADYVIPASFALIALGVVGVVWVHRFYKP